MRRANVRKGSCRCSKTRYYFLFGIVSLGLLVAILFLFGSGAQKPMILYINQGNGIVDEFNFGSMMSFAKSRGFNTIFFQIYREGILFFNSSQLQFFVANVRAQNFKIFFTLYLTNSTQVIPTSIYGLGEDGISLDMSSLPISVQQNLLVTLKQNYQGKTAVTTTDFQSVLRPDMLILETYGIQTQDYIHKGTIGSVGVFATTSKQDYQQQLQYAFNNSDGVMVFDYAGLLKSGY